MPYDRFMIAPINSGQQSDLKPFMIMDDSFQTLHNAYTFRGRVRKRFGSVPLNTSVDPDLYQQHTRLRYAVPGAITNIAGQIGIAPGPLVFLPDGQIAAIPGYTIPLGAMFSVGDTYYTVYNPAAGFNTMLSTNALETGSSNINTGQVEFATIQPPGTQLFYYPTLPVMGIETFDVGTINDNPTIAFDQNYAYEFAAGAWDRIADTIVPNVYKRWTGNDHQFFWCCNWRDGNSQSSNIFVTNFNPPDGIWYYNDITSVWTQMVAWLDITNQAPNSPEMLSCRILMIFKDRMVALNTWEKANGIGQPAINYRNRVRWSGNGSPLNPHWADNARGIGYGSYYDAPTKDTIITAQILKDRLIVYFDKSTWELVYTGNDIQPFRWQNINSELGAESTFSQVTFDKVVLGVGNVGILCCNGAQVERIDEKIPDEVYQIHSGGDGPARVAGIRDYFAEMVYWSFPSVAGYIADDEPHYPNRVLVYNYRTTSWAFNDDSITAFGYYYQSESQTWGSIGRNWENMSEPWNSGQLAARPRKIMAGNQQGFTFLVDIDSTSNSIGLSITNINRATGVLTAINHNLTNNSFIYIENCVGTDMLFFNDAIYRVDAIDVNTFRLQTYNPATNAFDYVVYSAIFAYQGGGTIKLVSVIDIMTKQYNLYLDKGRNAYIAKVDFLVDTDNGEMTVFTFPSYGIENLVTAGETSGALLGTNVLELFPYATVPLEATQEMYWRPIYLQAEGESVQLQVTIQPGQLTIPLNAFSDFQLNAFTIYAMPTTSRLQ